MRRDCAFGAALAAAPNGYGFVVEIFCWLSSLRQGFDACGAID